MLVLPVGSISPPMRARIPLYAFVLVSALAVAGAAEDRPVVAPGMLSEEIVALVEGPQAESVDVFLIFGEQPARAASCGIRSAYGARVAEVLRPTREALARIEPLLLPREERALLSVGAQFMAENALLRPEEREQRRIANAEATDLLEQMRREIVAEAWARCAPIQQPLVDHVEAIAGARVLVQTSVLNAVVVRMWPADLPALIAAHPEIAAVRLARTRTVSMDVSAPAMGADDWANNSVDGSNQKVAIVDTGVDGTHPALGVSGTSIVVGSTVKLQAAKTASDFNDDSTSTDDQQGHGTHLAGTVASQDSAYGGVAPGARLLNAKCFYRTSGNGGSARDADIVAASDWALTNGAGILNLSFTGGGTANGSSALTVFYDAIVDVTGASVAVAAGNAGPNTSTLGTPGDAFNAITVGAQDDRGPVSTGNDRLASFSSRGPTSDGRLKPDLVAPGVSIKSTRNTWEGSTSDFSVKSGTSMATPHIAGALALLLDHESNWEPAALKALLLNSTLNASPAPTTPGSSWGFGAADLSQAYTDRARVQSGTLTSTGSRTQFYALSSGVSGDRATLCWNRVAGFASGGRSAGGGTAKSLVNLDLALYDASSGSEHVVSTSTVDSVEQVATTSAVSDAVLKVKRTGAFPSGQTDVDFGVATSAAIRAVDPPEPVVELSAPDAAAGGGALTITATVSNDGGLAAIAPDVTLALPTGWSFTAGSPAKVTLSDIDVDGVTTARWDVVAATSEGAATLTASATTLSYGERFDSSEAEIDVDVDATPPTADAGDDVSAFATSSDGRAVVLNGSGSDDSGVAVTFAWDADGDGDFDDATGAAPTVTVPLGTNVVTLQVSDHVGNSATDTVNVQIRDNPPTSNAGADLEGVEGTPVFFNGAASTDIEDNLIYEWAFGDGAVAAGVRPAHIYGDNGRYTATLTVVDGAGQRASDTVVVDVANADPQPDAGPDVVTAEGRSVQFSGMAVDAGASDELAYRWTFGDGGSASVAAPIYRYVQDGVFTAAFTVTDEDGGIGADLVHVRVLNLPPIAAAGPDLEIDEGDSVSLHATGSDPGAQDVITFRWSLGDGTFADAIDVEHRYVRDGVLRVFLTVTDDAGAQATDEIRITVRNVAPEIVLPARLSARIGLPFALRLEPTDVSPTDAASLRVEWRVIDPSATGDGVVAEGVGRDVAWVADQPLDGLLEVRVFDDDTSIVRQTSLVGVTPPIADSLLRVFALGLNTKLEKKVVSALLGAASRSAGNAPKGALRKALRSVRRARRSLAKSGTTDPLLDAALLAIDVDLADLEAPPAAAEFVKPAVLGTTAEMISAIARAPFTGKRRAKLLSKLFALHAAARGGAPEAKFEKLRRQALAAAQRVPAGPASTWYVASLLSL